MDARVKEFHCIMPLENIPLVLEHGILSHERAARLEHRSVASSEVQERREAVQVPGQGMRLHQYANLYFHARNPMMYSLKETAKNLCVRRVSTAVLDLPGVVLADRNASSDYVRFLAPRQWPLLRYDDIFAQYWTHPDDPVAAYEHKSRKCAEVLVPNRVAPELLSGAYVVNQQAAEQLQASGFALAILRRPELLFA